MNFEIILLYTFLILAGGSALGVLLVKNIFYAALLLIACLLSIAGIFILSYAEFLAATQIMIYAGGILVLIIFGLMLTAKISGKPLQVASYNKVAGALVALVFFAMLLFYFSALGFNPSVDVQQVNSPIQTVGILLMTDYALPFEVSGILLLTSLVGAAITASSLSSKK